jgi:regulator of replication initiation timing
MENASKEVTEEMDDREKTIVRVNGEDRTVYRDQAQLMRDFDDVVDMGVSATKEGSGIAVEYQVSNADAQEAVEDILGMEMDEDIDFDALADAIMEKISVDMGATLAGWAGRSAEDMKHQMELELAHRRSTDMQQELEDLKKAQEELVFENKRLTSELSKYRTAIGELKESVQDINLSNARLLYTNRVLRNTSLNERQKDKIVEAISKSDSVAEARTIYNTLQSTVQSTPQRGPKSLSEAINRPSSLIRATRKESAQPTDVFSERMKRLAGIK